MALIKVTNETELNQHGFALSEEWVEQLLILFNSPTLSNQVWIDQDSLGVYVGVYLKLVAFVQPLKECS